jgi:hypothetical protein
VGGIKMGKGQYSGGSLYFCFRFRDWPSIKNVFSHTCRRSVSNTYEKSEAITLIKIENRKQEIHNYFTEIIVSNKDK